MMDTDQKRAAAIVVVDIVNLPKGMSQIQRCAVEVAGQRLKLCFPGFSGKCYPVQVVVDIEERVVLPVNLVTFINNPLAKPLKTQETLIQKVSQPVDGNWLIKYQNRRDHHRIAGRVHPQPRAINSRHRNPFR